MRRRIEAGTPEALRRAVGGHRLGARCRRPGAGTGRRHNFRGGGPQDLVLVRLSDGTFVRASAAWWHTDDAQQVKEFASGDVRQPLAGRYVFEGAVTNHIADDPVDITTTGGWAVTDASGAYTVDRNAAVAPDGTTTASRHNFGANAGDHIRDTSLGFVGSTLYRCSVWARTESGTKDFRIQINDGSNKSSGDLTATTTWQRFSFTVTTQAGPSANDFLLRNDSGGAAGSVLLWGAMVEDDAPDLDIISPVLAAGGTKAADDLEVAPDAASPFWTEGFWFSFWPYFSSADLSSHGDMSLLTRDGNTMRLRLRASGLDLRIHGDLSTADTAPLTWTARNRLDVAVEFGVTMRWQGFDSGDGSLDISSVGDWSGGSTLQVGARTSLANAFFGEISDVYPLSTAPI